MTLDEAFEENPEVSASEARREVWRHGADWSEFLTELGECETYRAREVLEWLGW